MKKGKKVWNRLLSLVLSLVMVTGVFAGMGIEAEAATEYRNFYLWCSTCNANIGAQAKVNGVECSTGDSVNVYTDRHNEVIILATDENHMCETINYPTSGSTFSAPIYHKTNVTVRVKDHNGNPIVDRTLSTNWNNVSGKTDANGEFKLATRSIWSLKVTVEDEYGNITKEQTASNNNGVMEITIPNRRRVTVNLKSEENQALTGASFVSAKDNEGKTVDFENDKQGVYTAILYAGQSYTLNITNVPGYENKEVILNGTTTSLDVKLKLQEPTVYQFPSTTINAITFSVGDSIRGLDILNSVNGNYLFEGPGGTYTWESDNPAIFTVTGESSSKTVTGVSAGTANLKVTVNSCGASKTTIIPVTVTKANPTVSVTAPTDIIYGKYEGDFTFNSNVAGTFVINDKSISVSTGETKKTFAEIVSDNPYVGEYVLDYEFTPTDTEKYNTTTGTVGYTVAARDISNALIKCGDLDNFVYDGQQKTVSNISVFFLDGETLGEDHYTVTYSNNINAGNNTAEFTITGKGNYTGTKTRNFSIQKAKLSVADVTAENRQYDGTDDVKIIDVSLNNLAAKDSVESVVDLSNATAKVSSKDQGTYGKITNLTGITLTDTSNYEFTDPELNQEINLNEDITISPKQVTIQGVAIETAKVYDGGTTVVITDKGTLSANYDGEKLYIAEDKGEANYTDKNVGEDKRVIFTEFELAGEEAPNYSLTQPASQTASIKPKKLQMVNGTANVKSKYYDGTTDAEFETIPTLNVADIVLGDNVSIDYSAAPVFNEVGSADEEQTVLVTTNLKIIGDDAANYDLQIPNVTAGIKNYIAEKDKEYYVHPKEGWTNNEFVIKAGEKCYLADTLDGQWENEIKITCETGQSAVGTKSFYVKITDSNGDVIAISKKVNEDYKIDKIEPTGAVKFTDTESAWANFIENITFGLFYKDAQEVVITAQDENSEVAKIEWYEHKPTDTEGLTLEEVEGISALSWKTYKDEKKPIVSLEDTKKFVYYVRITDNAGNVTYISSDGAIYDAKNPTITGVTNGTTCYATQLINVTDTNLMTVTLNDAPLTIEDGTSASASLEGNKEATYKIVAADKAGNTTTVTVTMKPITALSDQLKDITESNVKTSQKAMIQNIQRIVTKENVTNATEEEKTALKEIADQCAKLLSKIKAIEDAAAKAEKEKAEEEEEKKDSDNEMILIERLPASPKPQKPAELSMQNLPEIQRETITVPVSGEENTVHADVTVEGNAVYIQPLDEAELEHILGEDVETGVVEVDLTGLDREINEVNLPVETILSIVEAAEHVHNDTEALAIHLTTGTVLIDDQTMRAIVEAAHGETIHLVLNDASEHRLNNKQKKAIEKHDVHGSVEAYFVCTESNRRISDFEGGVATLRIPFDVPNGYHPGGFQIWYVDDEGNLELLKTWHEKGHLVWEVGHFSDFVIIYDEAAVEQEDAKVSDTVDTEEVLTEMPEEESITEKAGFPWWLAIAAVVVIGATGMVVAKKRRKDEEA